VFIECVDRRLRTAVREEGFFVSIVFVAGDRLYLDPELIRPYLCISLHNTPVYCRDRFGLSDQIRPIPPNLIEAVIHPTDRIANARVRVDRIPIRARCIAFRCSSRVLYILVGLDVLLTEDVLMRISVDRRFRIGRSEVPSSAFESGVSLPYAVAIE
jgi:hypothetical protein